MLIYFQNLLSGYSVVTDEHDIGYGGLDHVIASGENVNILVFDTEVYSVLEDKLLSLLRLVLYFAATGKAVGKRTLRKLQWLMVMCICGTSCNGC